MKVSLCVVAYNEEQYLPGLLRDIQEQTYPHGKIEVVLIDSMSEDGTRQCMEQFCRACGREFYRISVIANPGKIQSCGWNMALIHFTTDVIIRVDAHSHIPADFVEKQVKNLEDGEMVSGGVRPALAEGDGPWENTLLLVEESLFGSSASSFRRKGERAYVKSFFHGAYRREVFEHVGGFREDLGRTEDNELHYRIRKGGYRLCMSPEVVSYQYIRPNLRKMCRQKFGNGYWVGLTLGVCPGCLSLYHFVPGAFVAGIVMTSVLAVLGIYQLALLMWGLYWLLAFGMTMLAISGKKKHILQCMMPVLFFILHVSYGLGTIAGLVKMPFWRRGHQDCESVDRVRVAMEGKGEQI